jgi:hypothetical protein
MYYLWGNVLLLFYQLSSVPQYPSSFNFSAIRFTLYRNMFSPVFSATRYTLTQRAYSLQA